MLSQQITTFMHCTTHTDAPAHVIEGTPFMDEVPLSSYFGTGVAIPKDKWEVITAEDLESARREIREGDIVIVVTGWHRLYGDNRKYFVESPGTYKEAGEWLRDRKVKGFEIDCRALDHPLGTAIGTQPNGPLAPSVIEEYRDRTGRDIHEDFPYWEPCHGALLGNGICRIRERRGSDRRSHQQTSHVRGVPVALAQRPRRLTMRSRAGSYQTRCIVRRARPSTREDH